MILYKSTRGEDKLYSFSAVILKGIAEDGGLFVPKKIRQFSLDQLKLLVNKSYQERALFILDLFQTDFPRSLLKKIIYEVYSNNFSHPKIAPLKKLRNNLYILELWHGPTSAFKDIALQLMPKFFCEALQWENQIRIKKGKLPLQYLILVATSGDTGKAALEGYKNLEGISIIVVYPDKGVSGLQELHMTTQVGKNLAVYGMEGNFDDVQGIIKEIFNDQKFNKMLLEKGNIILSSANSINWGRLMPQIVYHVSSYLELADQKVIDIGEEIDIAVPTGNFGNILAAFYARKMGLPVRKLICASNQNNMLSEFLQTGIYDVNKRILTKTPSPSMDIIIAANIERLVYEITRDSEKVSQWMRQLKDKNKFTVDEKTKLFLQKTFYADWVSNDKCLTMIKKTYKETGCLIDPHTAVAQAVVNRYRQKKQENTPIVICSTAHWAKFAKDVYKALAGLNYNDFRLNRFDEFEILSKMSNLVPKASIPQSILELKNRKVRHFGKCRADKKEVEKIISSVMKREACRFS